MRGDVTEMRRWARANKREGHNNNLLAGASFKNYDTTALRVQQEVDSQKVSRHQGICY